MDLNACDRRMRGNIYSQVLRTSSMRGGGGEGGTSGGWIEGLNGLANSLRGGGRGGGLVETGDWL
jgi:hypothetical protein